MKHSSIVNELIEAAGDKVVELHFADGAHTFDTRANGRTYDCVLREGRIDNAITQVFHERAKEHEGIAVGRCDIFPDNKSLWVLTKHIADTLTDALEKGATALAECRLVAEFYLVWGGGIEPLRRSGNRRMLRNIPLRVDTEPRIFRSWPRS